MDNCKTVEDLISDLIKLPGIGYKTAQRLAYSLIDFSHEEIENFKKHLTSISTDLKRCPLCNYLHDKQDCPICSDKTRDRTTLMVISDYKNLILFENTNQYHGLYFCLDNLINPSKGQTPEAIKINRLIDYINKSNFKEIILSFSPTIEGETTSLYIAKLLKDKQDTIKLTKLASGIPLNIDLEYLDENTLASSLKQRRRINPFPFSKEYNKKYDELDSINLEGDKDEF